MPFSGENDVFSTRRSGAREARVAQPSTENSVEGRERARFRGAHSILCKESTFFRGISRKTRADESLPVPIIGYESSVYYLRSCIRPYARATTERSKSHDKSVHAHLTGMLILHS